MVKWRKSSHSDDHQGACVEVADLEEGRVGVRDSKDPEADHITVSPAEFAGLVSRIKQGELTL